jgi:hypothetical protein
MLEQKKLFFSTQSYFLALQDKVAKYKMVGINPPVYLLKTLEDAKCHLDNISKELE